MEESKYHCELKTSRNGLTVPVVNDIHLHSIYNPVKEAEAFAHSHKETLSHKNHVVLLGLGFGYHIEEVAKILNSFHDSYQIIVIEPNRELIANFNEKRPFEDTNIQILSPLTVKGLFEDEQFIHFLKTKPAIIKHDTSFSVDKKFYVKLLKYQAPTHIKNFYNLLNNQAQDAFANYIEQDLSFSDITNLITTKQGIKSKTDFAILAIDEMSRLQNHNRGQL